MRSKKHFSSKASPFLCAALGFFEFGKCGASVRLAHSRLCIGSKCSYDLILPFYRDLCLCSIAIRNWRVYKSVGEGARGHACLINKRAMSIVCGRNKCSLVASHVAIIIPWMPHIPFGNCIAVLFFEILPL